MTHELCKKYRPQTLDEVVGQDTAVKALRSFLKKNEVPHSVLFHGNSGCGKSSLARILAHEMHCRGMDLQDINCATLEKPLESARAIEHQMRARPGNGCPCRIWILEEVQSFSRAGFTQQAMLKMLEDTPTHVYFFLCTTHPHKLHVAIRNRCTKIQVRPLPREKMSGLLEKVAKAEGHLLDKKVSDRIIEVAGGCAREALKQLETVLQLKTVEEQLDAIRSEALDPEAHAVYRALKSPYTKWPEARKVLSTLDLDDANTEHLRRYILTCASGDLLKGKNPERAYKIIYAFEGPMYDSGGAGFLRACWDVVNDVGG